MPLSPLPDAALLSSSNMATNSFQSLHHHHLHRRHHFIESPPTTLSSSSSYTLFLKPTTSTAVVATSLSQSLSITPFSSVSFFAASTTTTPSTSQATTFDLLEQHLSCKNFRLADEETRRLLIVLAGEAAQKRGYVFFSETQFISETDLKAIDELWKKYSDGRFGYSVQKKIWKKSSRDFTSFFLKVGWMKKLDTEVEQYNYRSFPGEFMWEMSDQTPEGHLPLTNALRGTQLLSSILSHPAFEEEDDKGDGEEEKDEIVEERESENGGLVNGLRGGSKPLNNEVFKTDYSF
ncbi:Tetrapyrrole-binding protein, chloroplastic [Sarracenia purpurea var. burkii]